MKKREKAIACIMALLLLLIPAYSVMAEPSKNMRHLLHDSVSLMDFLCYRLEKELDDRYTFKNRDLVNLLYEIATKIKDKELIARLGDIKERTRRDWPPDFYADVYFDYSSNRLIVDCASHKGSLDDKEEKENLEKFKQFWDEPDRRLLITSMEIELLRKRNYNIGKVNEVETRYRFLHKYPRYEDLRLWIYSKIDRFDFHRGWRMTNYDEDAVKKELIERLSIRIFFDLQGRDLYREYSNGSWKKIELSLPPTRENPLKDLEIEKSPKR